jgi:hypothetical protein
MGNLLSTGTGGVEEVASQASGAYKYPPSSGGSFFANHFIMGGEKFDSPQPEAFLFGENGDLNFLGSILQSSILAQKLQLNNQPQDLDKILLEQQHLRS